MVLKNQGPFLLKTDKHRTGSTFSTFSTFSTIVPCRLTADFNPATAVSHPGTRRAAPHRA